jgi:hypothetical protein
MGLGGGLFGSGLLRKGTLLKQSRRRPSPQAVCGLPAWTVPTQPAANRASQTSTPLLPHPNRQVNDKLLHVSLQTPRIRAICA